jgi:hypothetical protein
LQIDYESEGGSGAGKTVQYLLKKRTTIKI